MNKKEEILKLVSEYIKEKHAAKTWVPGQDWVQYSGPYFTEDEYVRSISTLLDEWLVLGRDALYFEKKFPPLLGKKYGVVTNSGSSANLLMMAALTSKKIDKSGLRESVIVPVAGFPTTVNPIIQVGFRPFFVDIELDTLNLNLDQVEILAQQGVRYITFAHVLGNPPNMDRLMGIIKKYDMTLLEDCCDGLGSTYSGHLLGSFGRFSTCSFYPAHHMTMGEGGFIACNTEEDEKIVRSLREWGRGCYCIGKKANLSAKGTCGCRFSKWLPSLPDEIFDHKYVYEEIGYNLKPIEVQCSMGLAQINKLPMIHLARKLNHKRLTEIFTPYEEFFHFHKATPKSDPSWFAFPITVKDKAPFKRSHFTNYLENHKIQTRNYFGGNLLLQPAYQNLIWNNYYGTCYMNNNDNNDIRKNTFPVATKVTTDTLFLGTSPVITSPQLDYVEGIVKEFFKSI
jgi:CDP-4-dehydro-6-deoxyglucose reductase, E1